MRELRGLRDLRGTRLLRGRLVIVVLQIIPAL
jgi:hypothetical protein